jgi:hypothetical protein
LIYLFFSYDHLFKSIHKLYISNICHEKNAATADVLLTKALSVYSSDDLNSSMNTLIDVHIDKKNLDSRHFQNMPVIQVVAPVAHPPPVVAKAPVAPVASVAAWTLKSSSVVAPATINKKTPAKTNFNETCNSSEKSTSNRTTKKVANAETKSLKKKNKRTKESDNSDESSHVIHSDESNSSNCASTSRNRRKNSRMMKAEQATKTNSPLHMDIVEDKTFEHILEFVKYVDNDMTFSGKCMNDIYYLMLSYIFLIFCFLLLLCFQIIFQLVP